MPKCLKQLSREAYCSAPPLPSSSSIRPPRLTREKEATRPRTPINAQFGECKAEVSSIESVEFVAEDFKDFDVKPDLKIPLDPRQSGDQLRVRIAALAIPPPPSSDSSSAGEAAAAAPGPSRFGEPWGIRPQSHGRIPEGDLGQADPPRRRGRPKGSKSWPRVAFSLDTLPERQEKLRAEERLAVMSSK